MNPLSPLAAYIVEAAARRGIDPSAALRVAQSEGLNDYTGDGGSSFGPFQLHYGGVAPGGNRVAGLGDDFTKATGLDARDPSTVYQQIDFALDHAAKHGWGAFHGAARSGLDAFAGIPRGRRMNDGSTPAAGNGGATPWNGGGWQRNNGATPAGPTGAPSFGGAGDGGSTGRVGFNMGGGGASPAAMFMGGLNSGMGGNAAGMAQTPGVPMPGVPMPGYQPPQRQPGILSRLLFGQGGVEGMLPQAVQQHGLIGQFLPHGDAIKPGSDIWGTISAMPQWQAFAKAYPEQAQMVQARFSGIGAQPPTHAPGPAAGQPMQFAGAVPPSNPSPLPMMASGQQPQLPASLASLFGIGGGAG